MKIRAVEAIPYAIPYVKPLRFASGELHVAEHVLVRIVTDDGIVGIAEAPPRPFTYGETQASIKAIIDSIFAPQIIGDDPYDREAVAVKLHRTVGNHTAKAAIDMALWDILGQSAGISVTDLLGGYTDRLQVSHMLGFEEPGAMVAEAERMRATHGIRTFKVKVGRRPIQLDIDVCRALRGRFGDEITLYIDGNRGWTAAESARALDAMSDLGLSFAEELCPADDVIGRRWLAAQARIPLFADESATRPAEIAREVLDGGVTGISIKTARTGFTGSLRILGLCEGLGVDVVIGNQIDGQLGSLCNLAFGAAFERTTRRPAELSNFLDMSDDLLQRPLLIENGELRVAESAGLGADIDSDKLTHYRTDG
ncbi:mandelate racemase/muconate lactonizing enzyme family protein [Amorphoplanes digitatis]|uniref:L-alanine-DL-glutamate epimerase-like enolase superfamily enzyme n=1 Tax=Actinoplanes digitatis TaxID=1868 RepID=A0A7W7I297_9ACTN|nr:enolase C-terminal domain-like protein [Actinoplanes digitatis]MBB4765075.1 L-alanine-DL-glutamate epimerase-like enolase superfamily enzyme [Actinoplanes digitatis]GID97640.1 muconate cycloisomerase [Actinoplanes digitatis]